MPRPQSGHCFQVVLALAVVKPTIVMALSVEFNDQTMRRAVEVHNIGSHGMLTAKLETGSREDAFPIWIAT